MPLLAVGALARGRSAVVQWVGLEAAAVRAAAAVARIDVRSPLAVLLAGVHLVADGLSGARSRSLKRGFCLSPKLWR